MESFEQKTGRIQGLITAAEIIDAYPNASHAELMTRILARATELADAKPEERPKHAVQS